MTSLIKNELPPIYDLLVEAGLKPNDSTIYAYGEYIYNPSGHDLPEDLIVHEKTHIKQQKKFNSPDEWYAQYIKDPYFRISQEVEAYAVQYNFIKRSLKDRNKLHNILMNFATLLSGPMYGNVIGRMQAYNFISNKAKSLL